MVRIIVATLLLLLGLFILGVATLGIFRFNYILNRLHVAAKCDTLGAFLVLASLMIFEGISPVSIKIFLIIVFLWVTNPVASHLIGKTEVLTNPQLKKECEVMEHVNF